jgi:uncharacterized protein
VRVVIDTNIWISGLLWKGLPWKLLCLAEEGEVELCLTPAMLEELISVLAYEKFEPRLRQLDLTQADLLTYVMSIASVFDVHREGPVIVEADPDDDVFLHCATTSEASYVVSGDHHLLDLKVYADIPILTIREFFERAFPKQIE